MAKPHIFSRLKAAWQVLAGYHMQEWNRDRRYWVNRSQSARRDIPYSVRRKMLDWSRELERKDPLFNRFLDLNEQYVVGPTGLRIVSASENNIAARLMNDAWDGWQPYCDLSSRQSFGIRQGLINREFNVAGEIFVFLTFSGTSDRPRIQLIESERCETPDDRQQDDSIVDGVELDANDRPIAYWFCDEPKRMQAKRIFRRIDADRVIHVVDPSRVGQTRGLPIIYPVLKDLIDLSELQDLEMKAAKDAATISKIVNTQTGELTPEQIITGSVVTNTDGTKEYYKDAFGAETVVMHPGETYQQFASTRPSVAVQQFWDYVSARASAGMGLPIEVLIMRSLQGTVARGLYEMAHAYFRSKTSLMAEFFGRIWEHVMSNDVTTRNRLPSDFRRIRYTPPRSIIVDVGYNSKALIDEWRAGFITLEDIAGARGQEWEQILDQRARELQRAAQIEQDYQLEAGSILQLKESTPNPQQPQPEPETP